MEYGVVTIVVRVKGKDLHIQSERERRTMTGSLLRLHIVCYAMTVLVMAAIMLYNGVHCVYCSVHTVHLVFSLHFIHFLSVENLTYNLASPSPLALQIV